MLQYNIYSSNAYRTRMIGFKSELHFSEFLNQRKTQQLKGGFLIPIHELQQAHEHFVYYTLLNERDNISDYVNIYKAIAKLDKERLVIIKYNVKDINSWDQLEIGDVKYPLPPFYFYEFINGAFSLVSNELNWLLNLFQPSVQKNEKLFIQDFELLAAEQKLRNFSEESIIEVYVGRLLFDLVLSCNIKKGITADIDFIIQGTKELLFVELKEKNLARSIKGFGLDKHRIAGMKAIEQATKIPYYLVVREINNQQERIFVAYWIISLNNFIKNMSPNSIQGGYGMRSKNSSNPTFLCELKYFQKLS